MLTVLPVPVEVLAHNACQAISLMIQAYVRLVLIPTVLFVLSQVRFVMTVSQDTSSMRVKVNVHLVKMMAVILVLDQALPHASPALETHIFQEAPASHVHH